MDGADQPLFGETRRRDKVLNLVFAVVTAFFVGITAVMAIISSTLIKHHGKCLRLNNSDKTFCIYFADILVTAIIILLLVPQIVVAYWYRKGELEPKFRIMIYYNAVVTMLLCVCANLYFLQVGITGDLPSPAQPTQTSL